VANQDGLPWAHVILGGVEADKFAPDPAVPRRGTVLFVGSLLPHKGVNDLVDIVDPDQPLELIGRHYHAAFLAELQARAAGKCVTFRHDGTDADPVHAYPTRLAWTFTITMFLSLWVFFSPLQ
jgi:hypothetical protein